MKQGVSGVPPPSHAHLDLFLQVVTQQNVGVDEVVRRIKRHRMQGPATDIAPEGSLARSLWEHQPSDGGHKALGEDRRVPVTTALALLSTHELSSASTT